MTTSASTTLTENDREAILSAYNHSLHEALQKEHTKASIALSTKVLAAFWGKKSPSAFPKGTLLLSRRIRIHSLFAGGAAYDFACAEKPIPVPGCLYPVYPMEDSIQWKLPMRLAKEIRQLMERHRKAQAEASEKVTAARHILRCASTIEELLRLWPDAKPYLKGTCADDGVEEALRVLMATPKR